MKCLIKNTENQKGKKERGKRDEGGNTFYRTIWMRLK